MALRKEFKEIIRDGLLYAATFLTVFIPIAYDARKTQQSELTSLNREGESLVFRISNDKTESVAYDDDRNGVLDRQTKGFNSTEISNLCILLFSPVEYNFIDAPVDPALQKRYLGHLAKNKDELRHMGINLSGRVQLGWWYGYAKRYPNARDFGEEIWGKNWFERASKYPEGSLPEDINRLHGDSQ